MNHELFKSKAPTFYGWWEKRQKARQNRMPSHLLPPVVWPLYVHLALNAAILYALYSAIVDQDEYMTDYGPAIIMSVCIILLLYTGVYAVRFKRRYHGVRGERLAKINFWLMILAALAWPATVVYYLP